MKARLEMRLGNALKRFNLLIVVIPTIKSNGEFCKIKALMENEFILLVISFKNKTETFIVFDKSMQLLLRPLQTLFTEDEIISEDTLNLSTSCWEIKSPASDPVSRSALTLCPSLA
jgi:hypothetical protein